MQAVHNIADINQSCLGANYIYEPSSASVHMYRRGDEYICIVRYDTPIATMPLPLPISNKFPWIESNHSIRPMRFRELFRQFDWLHNFPLWIIIGLLQDCMMMYTHVIINHYNDVTMSAMASQITSLTIVYSAVYSGADHRKHQSFAPLAFVRGIHRRTVNSQRAM